MKCRYCHSPIERFSVHPVTRQLADVCRACMNDDAEDYAGITREEARREEAEERER